MLSKGGQLLSGSFLRRFEFWILLLLIPSQFVFEIVFGLSKEFEEQEALFLALGAFLVLLVFIGKLVSAARKAKG